jgi:hypothetical protein
MRSWEQLSRALQQGRANELTCKHLTSVMPRNYLEEFPIPAHLLPARLRGLLTPVGILPDEQVEVATFWESDSSGMPREHLQMVMAVVPEVQSDSTGVLNEASDGAVMSSVPVLRSKGDSKDFNPSISGFDYVVAVWADGSFRSYHLAEKVWMALGLTPRCIGGEQQRLIYDDLGEPVFDVAEGEVSSEFYFTSSRPVKWRMSNAYLRRYLWMRGAVGARVFFYQARLPDTLEMRAIMQGESHWCVEPTGGWFELDIREFEGELLMQLWASVVAVSCELSPEPTADGLVWPDMPNPVTRRLANSLIHGPDIYLDDRFLERYEQNSYYKLLPRKRHGNHWWSNPSYKGQWSFSDCTRVGRNLIQVPIRELYKGAIDREIVHAHKYALSAAQRAHLDLAEEHIVSKTNRLVEQLLNLGDHLQALGETLGVSLAAAEWVGLSRAEVEAEGWLAYPQVRRLAHVASLDMSQEAFLSRCKTLHEILQKIPNGPLRKIVLAAGGPKVKIDDLGSLKLLQALLNVAQHLDYQQESVTAWKSGVAKETWGTQNPAMAALFLNNDLRIADAHETIKKGLQALQTMGFDTASLNVGYGRALDFVLDSVINSITTLNDTLRSLLSR